MLEFSKFELKEQDSSTEYLIKKIKKNPIQSAFEQPAAEQNKTQLEEEEIVLKDNELLEQSDEGIKQNPEEQIEKQLEEERLEQERIEEEERMEKERLRQEKLSKLPEEAKDIGDFSSVDENEKDQLEQFESKQKDIEDDCVIIDDNKNRGSFSSCFFCGDKNHFLNSCPLKKQQGKQELKCYNCGEQGHTSRNCPQQTTKSNILCRNCGKEGHIARECSLPKKIICHNCGKEGHISKDCSEPRKKKICFKCGNIGHFTKDCPNKEKSGNENKEVEEGEMGEIKEN